MFDMVTRREGFTSQLRLTPGALLGVVFYAAVGALAVWAQHRPHSGDDRSVPVTFMKAPPPPPPPKGGGGSVPDRPKPRQVVPRPVPKEALIAPTVVPDLAPAPTPEAPSEPEPGGVPGGVDGGVAGGVVGGVVGGKVGGVLGSDGEAIDFDGRMTHPTYVSGPDPEYTEKALEREVHGTMLVRCLVTVDGKVLDCRVVKGLPYLDQAVIDALERRRYTPATLNGYPVQVNYTFKITMRLPE